jgi:CelD/BcsL family acetyltransferase involved in cellulose biosynthesis
MMLEPAESLEAVREEWITLAERTESIFATWEWASTWWRHLGGDRPCRVEVCRDGEGRLRAILPLHLWRTQPVRVLRFIGHGAADELGPVCAPGDRAFAVAALLRALEQERRAVLVADDLSGAWPGLYGRVLSRNASPVLRFSTRDWDDYLATRSAKFRSLVRYTQRRLEREHEVRYRLATATSLNADLETLFQLHEARWGGRSGFGKLRAFHHEFAAAAMPHGWLRLWLLELDGRPVAAWYGFRFAGAESYYQGGRDPALTQLSVGLALVAHSIRAAQADGLREYRFLRGDEPYKSRFANDDPGVRTLALASGRGGALVVDAVSALGVSRRLAGLAAHRILVRTKASR